MTYCILANSQRPHLLQCIFSSSDAYRVGTDGAIGIAPVSMPKARRAPLTKFRHRLMPLWSRSADTNAISRAVMPSISCSISQHLHIGVAQESNSEHAFKPVEHGASILRKDVCGLHFLVKNPSHDGAN